MRFSSVHCLFAAAVLVSAPPCLANSALAFERDVRPILKVHCFHCHGEGGERKGGLDVRLVRLLRDGGDSGSALHPGEPDRSLLWKQIRSDEMPRGEKKLSADEKETIRRWIAGGAATARPEPENVDDARFTEEEYAHWAFQPVAPPSVPFPDGIRLRNSIDGFIAKRLIEKGLGFSEQAGPRTLIRRVTFDLTGLPPTPEEVEAFLSDPAEDAYRRLVDRLLASPQFGVRWGRHWLDVAGYAESDGGASDVKRPYAWRYRDYVIDAFNGNKPIDAFILEQLAGDELVASPLDPHNESQLELLSATGFLRMAPDATQAQNTIADRNQAAAAAIQVVSSSLIGLTVGCAQCHDHKYDPIGIEDYYRFRAVFDPAFPLKHWQQPSARLVDLTPEATQIEVARIEAEAKRMEADFNQRRDAHAGTIQELKLTDVPESVRGETRTAVLTTSDERTERQKELLDLYPMVKPIRHIVGLLIEYDMPAYRRFEKEQQAITDLRNTKPSLRKVMVTTEQPGVVPTSRVFFRGNPEMPKETVQPGELGALTRHRSPTEIPLNDARYSTTGRRLAYALHLTDGNHPLTARVFVNRIWRHHMGRGLVNTPNDFGIAGDRPSHPRLLDWLASDFIQHGWDQKRLHRMILFSRTYQQKSQRRPDWDRLDPENRLFGRANLRRLEAESIRDALLATTDRLNDRLGGTSVPVTQSSEGKAVIGIQQIKDGIPVGADEDHPDAVRRSLYIELQRSLPLHMLSTFDLPAMTPNCDVRRPTTVANQSLWFLNDSEMLKSSQALARLIRQRQADRADQVRALFIRLFGVEPTEDELKDCFRFLEKQDALLASEVEKGKVDLEDRSLAILCQTLLASNRFLYVD